MLTDGSPKVIEYQRYQQLQVLSSNQVNLLCAASPSITLSLALFKAKIKDAWLSANILVS